MNNTNMHLSPDACAIEYQNVSKRFDTDDGAVYAVNDVSFKVRNGEFVSILGPSGCGKTTLLKMLAGLEIPTQGTIKVNGKEVKGPHQGTGIVFQAPALLKWRNSLENVLVPSQILGQNAKQSRERALKLLDLVGLREFAGKLPHELSGGMQQRVAIARALVHDPAILLMDEPFSALDTMTRGQLNVELLRIWSESRKTSMLITHSIPEAVFLSDRVIVMTARPAKVAEIVTIDLPRPRVPAMRTSPEFTKIVDHIGRIFGLEYM